jgi:hypothetical protein
MAKGKKTGRRMGTGATVPTLYALRRSLIGGFDEGDENEPCERRACYLEQPLHMAHGYRFGGCLINYS